MAAHHLQRLLAVLRFEHGVTGAPEDSGRDLTHQRLVLDKDDRGWMSSADWWRDGRRRNVGGFGRLDGCAREEDAETASTPRLRVHVHVTAALLNDPVHAGKSETRAPADILGREEGIKRQSLGRRVHPDAGVSHAERDIAARGKRCADGNSVDELCRDGERTAIRHRITRIRGQVDDRLL